MNSVSLSSGIVADSISAMSLNSSKITKNPVEIESKSVVITANKPHKKSSKLTPFEEYVAVKRLRPEFQAGFKVWLKGNLHHSYPVWDKLFHDYMNRTLN